MYANTDQHNTMRNTLATVFHIKRKTNQYRENKCKLCFLYIYDLVLSLILETLLQHSMVTLQYQALNMSMWLLQLTNAAFVHVP